MKQVDEFKTIFEYWRKRLMIKVIPIKQDNRYNAHFISYFEDSKPICIYYNSKKLKEWNYPLIMCGIFHELAHIKMNDMPYETKMDKIKEEYLAERYALDMIKKHYPFMMKGIIKHQITKLHSIKFRRQNPIHFKAFSQIKEYMI